MDDYSGHQCNKRPRMGNDYNNVRVYGGKVLAGNAYNYYSTEDSLLRLKYSKSARFNSQHRHGRTCHEGTRTGLLREIYNWVDGEDERHIFWLSGLAGTGKSTIAQTVARKYYDENPKRLGASFFFSRGGGDASYARLFVTTIAFQLANDIRIFREPICRAITEYRDLDNQSLDDQWRQLILRPLSSLEVTSGASSYLIVIDALDECDNPCHIRMIIKLISEARCLKSVRLKFFLTSRPENAIRRGFNQVSLEEHQDVLLHEIAPGVIDKDIALFLDYELRDIANEEDIGLGWPGSEQIRRLVEKSSGLFIWAATACRFIRQGKIYAEERLSIILGTQTTDSAPEKELDVIYLTVLTNSIPADFSEEEKKAYYSLLRSILGSIVVLSSPLSIQALSLLLDISARQTSQIVRSLAVILYIPEEQNSELRLHHPSFRDFLLNATRCTDERLQVDEKEAHGLLLKKCLHLLSSGVLRENICGVDSPGALLTEVAEDQIQQSINPAVQYACLYWVQHLQRSDFEIHDRGPVDMFVREHLLHWLEALSWMRKVAESIQAVTCLQSLASAQTCPLFHKFIQDVKRYVYHSSPTMLLAPRQLYLSALIFAPESSEVRICFQQSVLQWIKRLPVVERSWTAARGTLEGHTDEVCAVAFSPDGMILASASYDGTVRLWDTATGQPRQTLEGHRDLVRAVAFSPDGTILASASHDKTVRLWDTATGQPRQTLEGHTDWVRAVAFSPDGTILASASHDKTVRLWDTATGQPRQTLEGHIDQVTAVAFSPDGMILASASTTVRLWDTATGQPRQTLEGHTKLVSAVAFSPDGTTLASASLDKTIRLWDTATGQPRRTLKGHTDKVLAVAFSPDGMILASASCDKTVRLWDTATGQPRRTLKGHTGWVLAVAFSPDGMILASASLDKTVRLWDTATGQPSQTLEGHTGRVTALAFSPDGTTLVTSIGAINLNTDIMDSNVQPQDSIPAVTVADMWIKHHRRKILWLPLEYRSDILAVHGRRIAIGCQSGRVLLLEFNSL